MSKMNKTRKGSSKDPHKNPHQNIMIMGSKCTLVDAFGAYSDPHHKNPLLCSKPNKPTEAQMLAKFEHMQGQKIREIGLNFAQKSDEAFLIVGKLFKSEFEIVEIKNPVGIHCNINADIYAINIFARLSNQLKDDAIKHISMDSGILIALGHVDLTDIVLEDVGTILATDVIKLDQDQLECFKLAGLKQIQGNQNTIILMEPEFDTAIADFADIELIDIGDIKTSLESDGSISDADINKLAELKASFENLGNASKDQAQNIMANPNIEKSSNEDHKMADDDIMFVCKDSVEDNATDLFFCDKYKQKKASA